MAPLLTASGSSIQRPLRRALYWRSAPTGWPTCMRQRKTWKERCALPRRCQIPCGNARDADSTRPEQGRKFSGNPQPFSSNAHPDNCRKKAASVSSGATCPSSATFRSCRETRHNPGPNANFPRRPPMPRRSSRRRLGQIVAAAPHPGCRLSGSLWVARFAAHSFFFPGAGRLAQATAWPQDAAMSEILARREGHELPVAGAAGQPRAALDGARRSGCACWPPTGPRWPISRRSAARPAMRCWPGARKAGVFSFVIRRRAEDAGAKGRMTCRPR